jgi:hypothetical protein
MDTKEVEMEFVAAQGISYHAIVAVLTDLNDYWKILWFEKSNSADSYYTYVMIETMVRRGVAIGFLCYHHNLVHKMQDKELFRVKLAFDPDYEKDGGEDRYT